MSDEQLTPEEEEEAFSAGYQKASKDATAPAAAPEKEEEPAPEQLPPQNDGTDKFLKDLPTRLRAIEGSIGGLKSQLTKVVKDLTERSVEAPSAKEVTTALQDPEAYKELVEDYPGFAEVLKTLGGIQQKIEELAVPKAPPEPKDSGPDVSTALQAVDPDWEKTAKSAEFRAWSLDGGPEFEAYASVVRLASENPAGAQSIIDEWVEEYPEWWKEKGKRLFGPSVDDSVALLKGYKSRPTGPTEEQLREEREARLRSTMPVKGAGDARTIESDEEAFSRGFKRGFRRA